MDREVCAIRVAPRSTLNSIGTAYGRDKKAANTCREVVRDMRRTAVVTSLWREAQRAGGGELRESRAPLGHGCARYNSIWQEKS